jgi:hypothetical protein
MVTARELTQTLRARSAERRAKAEVRAERLRAPLPKAASMLVTHYQARRVVLFGSLARSFRYAVKISSDSPSFSPMLAGNSGHSRRITVVRGRR